MFRIILAFLLCYTAISQELPCSGDIQTKWIINDPFQFQAFSEAIKCTGEFDVEWNGRFIVDKTIQVSGGTVLNVTGADTNGNTFIDGGNSVQIFSVVNSELNLKDITLMNGNGTDGGAISAKSSKLSLVNTRFVSNNGQNGGAMYISQESAVYCSGSSFTNNTARYGGGMFMEEMSEASCGGLWTGNSAVQSGGAVRISRSSLEWGEDTNFESNIAGTNGGAVFAFNDSTVSWNTNVIFYLNEAILYYGGAMSIYESSVSGDGTTSFYSNRGEFGGGIGSVNSNIYMGGQTVFKYNSAYQGGAMFSLNTNVKFSGYSSFELNVADFGGGIETVDSTLSWEGQFEMIRNNGFFWAGAISSRNSTVSCSESSTTFVDNYGRLSGGAIRVDSSNISLRGVTTFSTNNVNESDHGVGGALDITDSIVYWEGVMGIYNNTGTAIDVFSSELSWKGNTTFKHNVQGNSLGNVLYVQKSNVSWGEGYTKFVENSGNGSTIDIFNSELSWSGYTEFVDNVAYFVEEFGGGSGGALSLDNTTVSWSGPTIFSGNTAYLSGAIDIRSSSNVSWSGPTEFVGNSADVSGGSISITKGNLSWTGDTKFTSNTAGIFGGAVYSSGQNLGDVNIYIYGKTVFENNTAPAGLGGALYSFGDISMEIDRFISLIFVGNKASVSGGAIYLSGSGNDVLVFTNVTFENNESGNGGGVDFFGYKTRFEDCSFVLNKASFLGGAMNSVGGTETFVRTVFDRNSGGTGGALRLAGTTSIDDCHFIENISDEGEGAAISNIGVVNIRGNNTFSGNTYNCETNMYLDYMEVDNPFEAICDGCEIECTNCVFSEGTVEPICSIVLDHSMSIGGQTTLEDISIEDGFWRATTTSKEILQCHNEDACLGGVTGSEGYCEVGYEGPYCGICSEGYSESLSFSCRKCSEDSSDAIFTSLIVSFVGLGSICILVSYLTSSDISESNKGLIGLLKKYVPLQSLKILVVTWQILTQFSAVANVTYPDIYQKFLDGLDIFNFDFSWILSAGCVMDIDFHDKLLMVTITPIVSLAFLACTYTAASWKNRENYEVLVKIQDRHVSMVLLLTFLVYSNVSSVLFKAFSCEHLDDGKYYVRSDYSIQCDSSKHVGFQVYAGVMIVVYTIGIPVFYGCLLFRDMDVLTKSDRVDDSSRVVAISDLWQPYRPKVFYYEIVECLRRIILSSVVVFIYPDTSAQIAITLLLSFIFVMVYEVMRPYVSKWDTWMSRIGQIVVFVSMYLALLLKVDVSGERYESQKFFEGVLVFANSVMIVVVIAEAIATILYLKVEKEEPREDINPMFKMFSKFSVRSNSTVITSV